ncbi:potassium channel family protein [Desulfotignum balticum]|uniref:potassium channel family protein n=1 Tax=Desulfotignum balticum TaxID=115781 RepID=UPI00046280CB|nr:potassium channel protein [Desulfotignum balticum]
MNLLKKVKGFRRQMRTEYPFGWSIVMGSIFIFLVILFGTSGYMLLEGWSFIESVYMVIITLSTVGFMEVKPLSDIARIMTMLVIFGGVGAFFYLGGSLAQMLVEGKFQNILGRRRVQKIIDELTGHYIVCGYGRIGRVVVQGIKNEGFDVVVIEKNPAALAQLEHQKTLFIPGDATMDEILLSAGLEKAKCLITVLAEDAANVFVTLTSRQLNPDITIVARTDNESHVPRLKQAGAERVFMPYNIGGLSLVQSVLRPTATSLMDLAIRRDIKLQLEELPISDRSELAGKQVKDSGIRPRFDILIVGIKKISGEMVFNPGPETVIEAGDLLIALGNPENLQKLQKVSDPDAG